MQDPGRGKQGSFPQILRRKKGGWGNLFKTILGGKKKGHRGVRRGHQTAKGNKKMPSRLGGKCSYGEVKKKVRFGGDN